MSTGEKAEARIERGDKTRNLPGTLTFLGVRALDPVLQYQILIGNIGPQLITTLGGTILHAGPAASTGNAHLDNLGLSPYRLILLAMATGSSVKHIAWKAFLGEETMAPRFGLFVGAFNTFFNTLNNLLFINRATSAATSLGEGSYSPAWPGARLIVGSGLFAAGIMMELTAEIQRKAFKSKTENKGRPHTSGLFGLARHVNYTGYTMWRMGMAVASGGWIWGVATGAFFGYDFATRAVPSLNEYCELRYADLWHDYQKKTPYVLVPYVY